MATESADRPAAVGRRIGPRRLGLLLSGGFGGLCAGAMLVVLAVLGAPYNPMWWGVMAAILLAAFLLPPILFLPLVDWVIDGYRRDGL
jgi:hypothetical protein